MGGHRNDSRPSLHHASRQQNLLPELQPQRG